MPAAVYSALQSAVLLCIDDNEDGLRPQAPIIMLSGAVDIPEQALKWVDAFMGKDCLASQLLPTIAQLYGYGSTSQPSCDA
jgi:hypothetical protein